MAKKDTIQVAFNAKTNAFPTNHYFNRFCVEKEEAGVLVDISYQGSDSFLKGTFSFFIPSVDIERQKENMLQYVDSLDFDVAELPKAHFPLTDRPVHTVRFIHAGRTGEHAELLLYNIPVFQEVEVQKNPDKGITADPLGAFSSPLSVHIELLKCIYVGGQ